MLFPSLRRKDGRRSALKASDRIVFAVTQSWCFMRNSGGTVEEISPRRVYRRFLFFILKGNDQNAMDGIKRNSREVPLIF